MGELIIISSLFLRKEGQGAQTDQGGRRKGNLDYGDAGQGLPNVIARGRALGFVDNDLVQGDINGAKTAHKAHGLGKGQQVGIEDQVGPCPGAILESESLF